MKIRVCYTIEVDDEFRKAWCSYYGKKGKASRDQLKVHFADYGGLMDDDIISEYRAKLKNKNKKK